MPDGRLLVCHGTHLMEMDWTGRAFQDKEFPTSVLSARRLPNGWTVVSLDRSGNKSLRDGVVILDQQYQIIKSIPCTPGRGYGKLTLVSEAMVEHYRGKDAK